MNVLLFSTIFPSKREPIRGLYNLRTFLPLSELSSVTVVSPSTIWKRMWRPDEWLSSPSEHYGEMAVTYPTYLMIPRLVPQAHAAGLYTSVRSHVLSLNRKSPIDVIVGVFAYPDVVVAARLADDLDLPLVAIVVGSDINDLAQRANLRRQIRAGLSRASYIVAVSGGLRDKVVDLGIPRSRVLVQHNGVDGERFNIRNRLAARAGLGVEQSVRLVGFVGNLVYEKGPDLLVEAFRHLPPDVHAVFLGEGSLSTSLEKRATDLGLTHRIRFVGAQLPGDVAQWLAACNVLCLPSRREGCPNVVLEALASGRPVVAASVGGVPEILSSSNGVLVAPDVPEAIANGIKEALRRVWDPVALRSSVPALSWMAVATTLHNTLVQAVTSYKTSKPQFVPLTNTP